MLCCHFILHLYNSTKIFPVQQLLDAELPFFGVFFYLSSVWWVQIFAIDLRNQISQLVFAALWTEKQVCVVVILTVKDSETQISSS